MILLCDSVQKADPQADALARILRFLSTWEPQAKKFLVGGKTENQLSYKDIQTALLSKTIPTTLLAQWQQQYALFVADVLSPLWESACQTAAQQVASNRPGFVFDPYVPAVQKWTETRAAALITQCTAETKRGIQAALKQSVYHEEIGVDELSKVIRPMIGLTRPQIVANQNYYNTLLDNGVKQQVAAQRSASYAARQHRYRAQMIARTESATAYNHAEYEVVRQAQQSGYMGKTVKVWCTAGDERTCATCGALNGKRIEFGADYTVSGGDVRVPPAHPQCRCTLLYEEIDEPPKLLNSENQSDIMRDVNTEPLPVTQQAIDTVSVPNLDMLSKKANENLQISQKNVLADIQDKVAGTEAAASLSMDGKEIRRVIGKNMEVSIPVENIDYISIHNHPSGETFSLDDVSILACEERMKILSVVGNNGNTYYLSKTDEFDFTGLYHELRNAIITTPNFKAEPQKYVDFMEQFLKEAEQYGLIYQKEIIG